MVGLADAAAAAVGVVVDFVDFDVVVGRELFALVCNAIGRRIIREWL